MSRDRNRAVWMAAAVIGAAGASSAWGQAVIRRGPLVNPTNKHVYYAIRDVSGTWVTLRSYALALGGDLATVNDAAENEWIRANLASHPTVSNKVWIGLNDGAVEGTLVWADGDPAAFRNWAAGEPSNSAGGGASNDYAQLGDQDGRWALRPAGYTTDAIVEVAGPIRVPQMFASIQAAIVAAEDGMTIEISPGTYNERLDLSGRDLTLRSIGGPAVTIVDAQQTGRVVSMTRGEKVKLQGLTLTGGRSSAQSGGVHVGGGGDVLLKDCVITGNFSAAGSTSLSGRGGGLTVLDAQVTVEGCDIRNNSAEADGGGIFVAGSTLRVRNSTIRRNTAGTIVSAAAGGGAIASDSAASARSEIEIVNCAIAGNRVLTSSRSVGGAMELFGSRIAVLNCTVVGNTPTGTTPAVILLGEDVALGNTILRSSAPASVELSSDAAVFNNIGNLLTARLGFRDVDPMLMDADGADDIVGTVDDRYELRKGSPAIDAGDAVRYAGPLFDLFGGVRIVHALGGTSGPSSLDVGAVEYQPNICPADLDDGSGSGVPDGGVGIEDLLYYLQRYDAGC